MSHYITASSQFVRKGYRMMIKPVFYSILFSNVCCTLNNFPSYNSKVLMVYNPGNYILYLSAKALCLSVFWPYTFFKLMTNPTHVLAFGGKYDFLMINPTHAYAFGEKYDFSLAESEYDDFSI